MYFSMSWDGILSLCLVGTDVNEVKRMPQKIGVDVMFKAGTNVLGQVSSLLIALELYRQSRGLLPSSGEKVCALSRIVTLDL